MTLHHGRMIYNRKGAHLTVLPEKEWLSANTMQEGTRLFGTLPFLLYIVLQVALFVFRILLLHSDSLSGHRLHIFHRVPAFLPVSLRFSDVSGHNPVVVLSIVFYLDIPRSLRLRFSASLSRSAMLCLPASSRSLMLEYSRLCSLCLISRSRSEIR